MSVGSEKPIVKYTYTHEAQREHNQLLDLLKLKFQQAFETTAENPKHLQDFDIVQSLGKGAFGTVFLVRDKNTLLYHAMKAMEKELIIKKKCFRQLLYEKRILQSVNFCFIVNLDFCFKDNMYVYLILPFQAGGDIFSLLRKFGGFSEEVAQFYSSQIVMGLEYLHHCGIVHRDLKPENILISENGYIKIADLGFSKIIKTRTWTLLGTPEYLAPEIFLSKGYSFPVDWWSLGVLIYEMLVGYTPFYSTDVMQLYDRVLSGHFKTPDVIKINCKNLLKKLLQVDPLKRLGSLKAGVYDIKSHVWFSETNWQNILNQKERPQHIPVLTGPGDSSNFREFDDVKIKCAPKVLFEKEFENF